MIHWRKITHRTAALALAATALTPPLVFPVAPAQADTQNGCVSMGQPSAGSFWRVYNNCGHSVIGKFCYENDGYFSCSPSKPGGFGPIGPGKSEGVSGPGESYARYRVSYCNYDDWNSGYCSISNP